MKRRITAAEFEQVSGALNELSDILLAVGIVELKISKAEALIFWDTEGKGKIDPDALTAFCDLIERHWWEVAQRDMPRPKARKQ